MKFNLPGGIEVLRSGQKTAQKKPAVSPPAELSEAPQGSLEASSEVDPPKPKRGRKPKKTEIVD